jgi:hypothetical protein
MPDRQDDLNPGSNLAPFAEALKRLAPQAVSLSRDALLFEAGKAAAAPRLAPWVWPSATGTFAAISLVLAAFLLSPNAPAEPRETRTVYVHPEPPRPQPPDTDPKPAVAKEKPKSRPSEERSEVARLLQQKRDVLRWGLDMLPDSKPTAGGPSADVTAREVTHWLNLPPGTFALPAATPKKPAPKEDDDSK